MSNESRPDRRASSDPVDAAPWAWILIGAVLFAVGCAQIDDVPNHSDRVFGLVIAFLGAAMALVGTIAMGVEIALRRNRR